MSERISLNMNPFSIIRELYRFYRIRKTILAWQKIKFPSRTHGSVSEHLRREAIELKEQVDLQNRKKMADEIVDVQILLWCLAEDAGIDITDAIHDKFYNDLIHRKWSKPDEHGVVEHVRD